MFSTFVGSTLYKCFSSMYQKMRVVTVTLVIYHLAPIRLKQGNINKLIVLNCRINVSPSCWNKNLGNGIEGRGKELEERIQCFELEIIKVTTPEEKIFRSCSLGKYLISETIQKKKRIKKFWRYWMTDENRNIVAKSQYDPWGNILQTNFIVGKSILF